MGSPIVSPAIDNWKALVIEAVLTFFLVWVVFATAADPRGAFEADLRPRDRRSRSALVAGPLTGSAMNPARAFGPESSISSGPTGGSTTQAPFAGAVIAALIYGFHISARHPGPCCRWASAGPGVAERSSRAKPHSISQTSVGRDSPGPRSCLRLGASHEEEA